MKGAEYGKLLSRIWSDPDFIALDARAQQVYCLLLSFPTRNHAGVLPLTLKRWARCTAGTAIEDVVAALRTLAAARFVVVDWESEELLVRTYIRNDEVYRQPNVMKSALKSARQVQSAALRWALHDELLRLPSHKLDVQAAEVANMLVEGVERPFAEGFGEGFREGFAEPQGVGDYVSTVGIAPPPTPAPTPAAATLRAAPPDLAEPAEAATSGADLVRRIIPSEHPAAVRTMLRIKATELVKAGTPPATVAAALRLWLTKPNLGPGTLPALVSEVIRRKTSAPNGFTAGESKVLGWAELATPPPTNARKELT